MSIPMAMQIKKATSTKFKVASDSPKYAGMEGKAGKNKSVATGGTTETAQIKAISAAGLSCFSFCFLLLESTSTPL